MLTITEPTLRNKLQTANIDKQHIRTSSYTTYTRPALTTTNTYTYCIKRALHDTKLCYTAE